MLRSQRVRVSALVLTVFALFYAADLLTPEPGIVFGRDSATHEAPTKSFNAESAIEGYFDLVSSSDDSIFQDVDVVDWEVSDSDTNDDAVIDDSPAKPSQIEVQEITLSYGDNLSSIFETHKVPAADLLAILNNDHPSRPLRRILVGEKLQFMKNAQDGTLETFTYIPNRLNRFVYSRSEEGWQHELVQAEISYETVYRYVVINRGESPITAGLRAGIRNEETILELTQLLQWNIDFWLDIRPNDNYKILYKELYLDGEYAEDADILAAEFKTQRGDYRILRYEIDGVFQGYYKPDGSTMKRQFLRAPLDYVRVSSDFSPRRFHPVIKVYRPHNGVDYAAPTGTPVRATADGIIKAASYTKPNGNYVFIRHPPRYETRYLHFSRIAKGIKKGVSVKQGEIVGYVGSTGYSTGPHLHYEFLVNGKHVNPRTFDLPKQVALTDEELVAFKENVKNLNEDLDIAHHNWLQQNSEVTQVSN